MPNEAKWVCECGKETVQPQGGRIVERCPDCNSSLSQLREPDGSMTSFVVAPEWFLKEWQEHMAAMQKKDVLFRQLAFQEVEISRQKIEAQENLKSAQKKTRNIIEAGARRLKLLKQKDVDWGFNAGLKRFVGRKKPEVKGA